MMLPVCTEVLPLPLGEGDKIDAPTNLEADKMSALPAHALPVLQNLTFGPVAFHRHCGQNLWRS